MSEDNHFSSKSSAPTIHASFLVKVQKQKEHALAGATLPPSPPREHKDRCILPFKGKHLVSCKCTCSFPHLSEAAAAGPISISGRIWTPLAPPWITKPKKAKNRREYKTHQDFQKQVAYLHGFPKHSYMLLTLAIRWPGKRALGPRNIRGHWLRGRTQHHTADKSRSRLILGAASSFH